MSCQSAPDRNQSPVWFSLGQLKRVLTTDRPWEPMGDIAARHVRFGSF
ncbi:unnamed protein product, partial [Staurois parvus]